MSDLKVEQLIQKTLQQEQQQIQQDENPTSLQVEDASIFFFLVIRMDAFALSLTLETCCDLLTLEATHFLSGI